MPDIFDSWAGLGGTFSHLAAEKNSDGRLELFAVDGSGIVQHTYQTNPGGGWSPWLSFPETNPIINHVVAARNTDGSIEIFATTEIFADPPPTNVLHARQGAGPFGWTDWAWLSPKGSAPPLQNLVAGTNADGRLEIFGRSRNDGIAYHIYQTKPGSWDKATWSPLGATVLYGPLAVARDADGKLQLFSLDADRTLIHVVESPSWSDWRSLGLTRISSFQIGTNHDGRLEVFAVTEGGALWHMSQQRPGSTWNGAEVASIGGRLHSDLAVGQDLSGALVAFSPRASVAKPSDGVVDFALQSEAWAEWHSLESRAVAGQRFSHLHAIRDAADKLTLFALNQDGAVWWISQSQDVVIDYIKQIVKNVAPIVYLHPDEHYKPSSVEFYFENVQFVRQDGSISGPPMTSENLPMGPEIPGTHLSIPARNDWVKAGDLASAKAYVHVLALPEGRGFDLQYFFFYPYNGTVFLGVKAFFQTAKIGLPFGSHQGDWESIIVRVDRQGKVLGIYCNQHSGGAWYLPGSYDVVGQQPVVYSALHGHPTFPRAGDFPTEGIVIPTPGFTFFLDNQTKKGDAWDCSRQHELVAITGVSSVTFPEPWWLDFLGRYGGVPKPTPEVVAAVKKAILGWLLAVPFIPAVLTERLAEEVAAVLVPWYYASAEEGPTAPKGKGWWNQVIPDGPGRVANVDVLAGEVPRVDLEFTTPETGRRDDPHPPIRRAERAEDVVPRAISDDLISG